MRSKNGAQGASCGENFVKFWDVANFSRSSSGVGGSGRRPGSPPTPTGSGVRVNKKGSVLRPPFYSGVGFRGSGGGGLGGKMWSLRPAGSPGGCSIHCTPLGRSRFPRPGSLLRSPQRPLSLPGAVPASLGARKMDPKGCLGARKLTPKVKNKCRN